MKARILVPLFAALVFTGTARSETPGQPRPDGPPPGGPMAERLKHRLEELRRDGKHEEAERLEHHAREMWEHHRGNPQGERREESHHGMPSASPGEREAHLAEAAKHLRAAGIDVSPEMLEKLSHRFAGKMGHRPPFSPRSPGEREGSAPGHHPFPPMGSAAPGAGSPLEAMHNEIRTLARQVQELRAMVQHQHGGERPSVRQGEGQRGVEPGRGPKKRGFHRPDGAEHRGGGPQAEQHNQDFHRPNDGEHHGERSQGEQHRDRDPAPGTPGATREHREGPPRNPGEIHPRGDDRPSNPPGYPPLPPDRPRGDAPVPPRQ